MVTAHKLARSSEKITAAMVEATEFPHLAQRHAVRSVPKVILNDRLEFIGALPEEEFVKMVLEAGSAA